MLIRETSKGNLQTKHNHQLTIITLLLHPETRSDPSVSPTERKFYPLSFCFSVVVFPSSPASPYHIQEHVSKNTTAFPCTLSEPYLFNKPVTLHTLHWTTKIDTIKTLLKNKKVLKHSSRDLTAYLVLYLFYFFTRLSIQRSGDLKYFIISRSSNFSHVVLPCFLCYSPLKVRLWSLNCTVHTFICYKYIQYFVYFLYIPYI